MKKGVQTVITPAASIAPTMSCFEAVMVEMVNMEEMGVMEYLVVKDHQDLQENLVQQVDLKDLKASQELGEHLDHKELLDQPDQGVEG